MQDPGQRRQFQYPHPEAPCAAGKGPRRMLACPAAGTCPSRRAFGAPQDEGAILMRVDDLEKGESMEVGVPCADLEYSVLAHKDGGVRVVDHIAGEPGKFGDHFLSDIGVALCRDKHPEARRAEKSGDKRPGVRDAPWLPHDARVGRHPHEFVKDRPGRVPGVRTAALALDPLARFDVPLRIRVRGVDEDVRVDENQPLSSFHGLIQGVPVRDVDPRAAAMEHRQGRKIPRLFSGLEEVAQRSLDQVRHRTALPRRLALELSHDRVVDIERRLHMENHTARMAINPVCLRASPDARNLPRTASGLTRTAVAEGSRP